MKKIIPFFLLSVLLLSAHPVQAGTAPAWYHTNDAEKRIVVIYGQWINVDGSAFSIIQNGIYTLVDSTFLTTDMGLSRVSGSCRQGKGDARVVLRIFVDGTPTPLANTNETVFAFSAAFPSGNAVLQVYGAEQVYNELFCNVLFEKVR